MEVDAWRREEGEVQDDEYDNEGEAWDDDDDEEMTARFRVEHR